MKSNKAIIEKIGCLKELVKKGKGTPCEVYSRVVGYLRRVQSWNPGRKEEYFIRKKNKIET